MSVCFLLPWKSRHRVRLLGEYRTWTIWQYRSIWLVYANSRTSLLTQWLQPLVKCCLWITEWLNRVRVRVMVKVRDSVRVVVRVRVLSASTCLPTECSANLHSAFYPWPVVVRYDASCSYVSSYTHLLIRRSSTKSAALNWRKFVVTKFCQRRMNLLT